MTLFLLPPCNWQHSRELLVDVVLGRMDAVLDGHISVRLHVSNTCIPPLAFGGSISFAVTVPFPSSRPGTASFTLLPLSMPPGNLCRVGGWQLRRKPRVEFLYVLFPCSILGSRFCALVAWMPYSLLLVDSDKPMWCVIEFRRPTRHYNEGALHEMLKIKTFFFVSIVLFSFANFWVHQFVPRFLFCVHDGQARAILLC